MPWFSKVLEEQTRALAAGELEVGGARARRLASKTRLARSLGAPPRDLGAQAASDSFGLRRAEMRKFRPGTVLGETRRAVDLEKTLRAGRRPPLTSRSVGSLEDRDRLDLFGSGNSVASFGSAPPASWGKIATGKLAPYGRYDRGADRASLGVGERVDRAMPFDNPHLLGGRLPVSMRTKRAGRLR